MDDKDMQSNLGTIAKSGTEEFIKKMGDKKGDINQIGKFGVGFYSSFMVSDQVVVRSKKYNSSSGYLWTSDGKGTFSIEGTEYNEIGTEITLSIKKDEKEFLSIRCGPIGQNGYGGHAHYDQLSIELFYRQFLDCKRPRNRYIH